MAVEYNFNFELPDPKKDLRVIVDDILTEVTKSEMVGDIPLNPRETGRLEASWDVNTSGVVKDAGEGIHSRKPKPSIPDNADVLYITNGAPYAGWVEAGINPRAGNSRKVRLHTNFVKNAIERAIQ